MEKYYIPLLFIAVAALALFTKFGLKGGAGLGFVNNQATQSATPTFPSNNGSRWTTYSNADLGFSLSLPEKWSVDLQRSDREKSGDDVVFYIQSAGAEQHEGISVDLAHGKTVDDTVKSYKGKVLSTNVITIDGEIGKEIETGEMGLSHMYVVHNGRLFSFTTQGGFEKDGVLATFKFL